MRQHTMWIGWALTAWYNCTSLIFVRLSSPDEVAISSHKSMAVRGIGLTCIAAICTCTCNFVKSNTKGLWYGAAELPMCRTSSDRKRPMALSFDFLAFSSGDIGLPRIFLRYTGDEILTWGWRGQAFSCYTLYARRQSERTSHRGEHRP